MCEYEEMLVKVVDLFWENYLPRDGLTFIDLLNLKEREKKKNLPKPKNKPKKKTK